MVNINNIFCHKNTIFDTWQEKKLSDIEKFLSDRDRPYSKSEKGKISLFGFAKPIGEKENNNQYPTNFIILEIDTPKEIKKEIEGGNNELEEKWIKKFKDWFIQFKNSEILCYYIMYLTPSMRGIRFILKSDKPIENEAEYKEAVLSFLEKLEIYGIGEKFHDVLINQAWFYPTFKKFFHKKEKISFSPKNEEKKEKIIKNRVKPQKNDVSNEKKVIKSIFSFLEKEKKSITEKYSDWIRVGFALVNTFSEKESEDFFLLFSKLDKQKFNQSKCKEKIQNLFRNKKNNKQATIKTITDLAKSQGWSGSKKYLKKIEEKYKNIVFWKYNPDSKNNRIEIIQVNLCRFLSQQGFSILKKNKSHIYIHSYRNIIKEVEVIHIKQFIKKYITNLDDKLLNGLSKDELLEKIIRGSNNYFGKGLLEFMDVLEKNLNKDSKDEAFFYFENEVVRVSAKKIELISYEELQGYVWQNQVIKRKILIQGTVNMNSDFVQFLKLVSSKDEIKFKRLMSILGFLLHNFKDSLNAKAVVFSDKYNNGKANGGTGKSLTANSIGKLSVPPP